MTAEEFKALYKSLGMTQEEVGKAIGYSRESISRAMRTKNLSESMAKVIELLREVIELRAKVAELEYLGSTEATLELLTLRKRVKELEYAEAFLKRLKEK